MAHRHRMQARARGGGIKHEMEHRPNYTAPGSSGIAAEAESKKETFAHGGKSKKRADRKARGGATMGFKSGGKVWSHAAGGIRGKRGMAAEVMRPGKLHAENHDNTVKAMGDHASGARSGHGAKARHQLATGGRAAFEKGGKCEPEEED